MMTVPYLPERHPTKHEGMMMVDFTSWLSSPGLFGLPSAAEVSAVTGFVVVGALGIGKLWLDRDKRRPVMAERAETKRRAETQRRALNSATRRGDLKLGGNSGQFVSPNLFRGEGDAL